jgi:hypothetical protein
MSTHLKQDQASDTAFDQSKFNRVSIRVCLK